MLDKIYNWFGIPFKWLSKQWEWIKSIFTEPDGKTSFRRIFSAIIILEFVRVYERVSWYNKKMEDITDTWLILILTALGYSILDAWIKGKFGQGNNQNNTQQ